jgi:prepilin peptidase CpaA
VALVTFAFLAVLFAIRAMGGGDVKLLTALALWIQPAWFLKLLVGMALIGGVLTLLMGAWHVARRRKNKLAIPYGVAISAAGLWVIAAQISPAFQKLGQAGGLA